MGFELFAVPLQERGPVEVGRDGAGLAEHIGAFLVHLQEKQVGELLDVIAVGDAVVAQNVAVVPDALDDGGRSGVHSMSLFSQPLHLHQMFGGFKFRITSKHERVFPHSGSHGEGIGIGKREMGFDVG